MSLLVTSIPLSYLLSRLGTMRRPKMTYTQVGYLLYLKYQNSLETFRNKETTFLLLIEKNYGHKNSMVQALHNNQYSKDCVIKHFTVFTYTIVLLG